MIIIMRKTMLFAAMCVAAVMNVQSFNVGPSAEERRRISRLFSHWKRVTLHQKWHFVADFLRNVGILPALRLEIN